MDSSRTSESLIRDETNNLLGIKEKAQDKVSHVLESRRAHWVVLGLVVADFISVLSVIIVSFSWPKFEEEEHIVFVILEMAAFTINTIFVIEVMLKLFVFGIQYYTKVHHWKLHLFDAIIVLTTFFLEFFLSGKQREVAGLLVLFRLWRLIKVLSTFAVGLMEYDEDKLDRLSSQRKQLKEELGRLLMEIDKISKEDNWDERKRDRIFNDYQNYLMTENFESNDDEIIIDI